MVEEVKVENIDPWTQSSKGFESVRNIEALPPDVADQTYGKDNETLDAGIALRNLPKQTVYTPYVNHSSRGSGGTGLQTITGVGFKPSVIIIQAVYSNPLGSLSWGQWNATTGHFNVGYGTNPAAPIAGLTTNDNNYIIYMISNGSNITSAAINSVNNDGFVLNWTNSTFTCIFQYQCYP